MSERSVNNYNTHESLSDSENDDYSESDPRSYYRNISLRTFAAAPLTMLTEHTKLKELCLENDNPEAHYIEGLLQYFHHKQQRMGLRHLRESAILNNENGMYLYGLLMIAHGHYWKCKKYMDKLQWRSNVVKSEQCWERIKNSLRAIPVKMTQRYHTNWVNLRPRTVCCDTENMTEVCKECYYYKRLTLFLEFAGYPTK